MRRLQVLDEWIRLGDRLEQPLVLLASLTHSADERLEGDTPVRYNYPRPLGLMPDLFVQRPASRLSP